ncbi:Putative ribonuclease H protein At1g65750 [Linum perenne]
MTPPNDSLREDVWSWGGESNGKFTIRSAYNLITGSFLPPTGTDWKKVWNWRGPNREVSWTPGPNDWLIINTDGSVKQPLSEAAAGGLVRNSSGHCLLAFTANLGSCSITRAELRGILIGLRLAWNAGYKKIIVQTDSQVAVQLLTDESSTNHHHGLEISQFKEFNARSWEIRIQHIYREGNRAADFLASIGHQRPIGIHSIPTSDCNLGFHLLYDALGISESRSILSN